MTFLFGATACGKQVNATVETESYIETHDLDETGLLIQGLDPYGFKPYDPNDDVAPEIAEEASKELSEEVNSLGREIADFLNQKYDLNWEYTEIPVFTFSGNNEYGGFYFTQLKRMYINTDSCFGKLEDGLSTKLKWVISHELIHAITDSNRGTPFFYKLISPDEAEGVYLHEAITELLTEQFWETKGINSKAAYPEGGTSGYVVIVYFLKATEVSFEGTIKDLLNDNMSEVENRMETQVGDNLAFDRWLCLSDITQLSTMNKEENSFFLIEVMTEYLWYTTQDEEALLDTINAFFDTVFGYYTDEYKFETIEDAIYTMDILSYDEE